MTTSSLAQVAKLVDAGDSKSPAARCVGSSPTLGTKFKKPLDLIKRFFVILYLQKPSPYSNCQQSTHIKLNKTVFFISLKSNDNLFSLLKR